MRKIILLLCGWAPFAGYASDGIWDRALSDKTPLDVQWVGEIESEGVRIRRLRYTGSTWKGEPQRVYGLYAQPEGEGPFPAILQIHGGGQTCYPFNLAFFVKHGYACLSFDWTGPRDNRPEEEITMYHEDFRGSYMDPEDPLPGQSLVHHAVLAAIRGIDILCQQPVVDRDRIGVQGISWGGYITWLVNGLDLRLKAAVPVYGVGGLEKQWSGMARSLAERTPEFRDYWRANYDPESFATRQQGAVMYVNASNDFFGQLAQAEERLASVTVPHRRTYGANRMHSLDPESVAAGMAWFDFWLKDQGPFPEEPRLEFEVGPEGILSASLTVDETCPVDSVRVDYSQGYGHALVRCWLSVEAERVGPGLWSARIPVVQSAQPVAAIPQTTYVGGFLLSGAVREVTPMAEFPQARGTLLTTDVVSDWNNGPSGWAISQSTDFPQGERGSDRLVSGTVEEHAALLYESVAMPKNLHVLTRLVADPSRNKGNVRTLEIWTHDLKNATFRTNQFLHVPGADSFEATFEGGDGWKRNLLPLDRFKPTDGAESRPLANWNDVYQFDLIAETIADGTPAIGLLRWTDPVSD